MLSMLRDLEYHGLFPTSKRTDTRLQEQKRCLLRLLVYQVKQSLNPVIPT